MILGDRELSFSWKGLLKKVTSCLLVVDVVLDHDESGNNLCAYTLYLKLYYRICRAYLKPYN